MAVTAYYNENNKFAAATLRELAKAGLIAPGEVDERSIEDVLPSDLAGFTQCHFFAGSLHRSPECSPSPVNGLWRDADWLFCRDDKWRPVEPGTFPLASGAPARVGRLRGYGNAINVAQAEEFVRAYMQLRHILAADQSEQS